MRAEQIFRDQRGVALPMAMIVLVLLTTLMLAFAVLTQTEPVIAHNQMEAAQARAHAEAGFERAVWALSQGVVPPPSGSGVDGSLASPLPPVMDPRYNGSDWVANGSSGAFQLTVTSPDPAQPNLRRIVSIGKTPAEGPERSRRRIQADVERLPPFAINTPCALCVRGDLGVGGSALVDGTTDPNPDPNSVGCSGGIKKGAIAAGSVAVGGSAQIHGDSDTTANNVDGGDYLQNQNADVFAGITLNASNFKTLRHLAKQNGTYFGPGYPNGTASSNPYSGTVQFDSTNKLKNGIVFIDTVSGNDIPADMASQNPADFANVTINGNPFVSGDFAGWIVVNGSLAISGNMKINGLVYAVNDFVYNGTGTGQIVGLAVSQNIRDVTATAISGDSTTIGQSKIKFNCANLTPPPNAAIGYTLVPGTYRELSD